MGRVRGALSSGTDEDEKILRDENSHPLVASQKLLEIRGSGRASISPKFHNGVTGIPARPSQGDNFFRVSV